MGKKPTEAYKASRQACELHCFLEFLWLMWAWIIVFEYLNNDAAQLMIATLKQEDMTDDNAVVTLLLHKSGELFPIAGRSVSLLLFQCFRSIPWLFID